MDGFWERWLKVEGFWYSNGCMQTVSDLLCGRWVCGLGIYRIMDDGGGGGGGEGGGKDWLPE